jgi:hypothetical protein
MIHTVAKYRFALSIGGVALTVMLATGVAQSAATRAAPDLYQPTAVSDAQQLFADAPDGVDSMVTGPVSASFRQKQADLGCAKAVWPDVPAACYPK